MTPPRKFRNAPLTEMVAVGAVEARAARLWMRAPAPESLRLRWWPEGRPEEAVTCQVSIPADDGRDGTTSVRIPDGAGALVPLTRYRYHVTRRTGEVVGQGGFETAPPDAEHAPDRYAVALLSCNQPFDADGTVRASTAPMLRAAQAALARHDVKFVFTVGDQMYSDHPPGLSLLNPAHFRTVAPDGRARLEACTAAEVRRLYQQRYRHFWNVAEWKALHAAYPCYPILDDHELVDNWGSRPEHATDAWQRVAEGARLAYSDYQASRLGPPDAPLPEDFHYAVDYGSSSAFVMDLRSNRSAGADARLFGEEQRASLRRFLDERADRAVLFLVLSVPLVHLPLRLARLQARLPFSHEDFSDRWTAPAHQDDRDWLLRVLHGHQLRHPEQRLVLLSGDIHIGCVHRGRWRGRNGPTFHQVISSPITHAMEPLLQLAARLSIRFTRGIETEDGTVGARVRLLDGVRRAGSNPYGGLNVGIVEIDAGRSPSRLRFHLYGHRGDEPVCAYRSGWE